MSERLVSRHVTNAGASKRLMREVEKLRMPGKRSSGWSRRKFMIRRTSNLIWRYKVVEL